MEKENPLVGRKFEELTREELLPYEGNVFLLTYPEEVVWGVQKDRNYNPHAKQYVMTPEGPRPYKDPNDITSEGIAVTQRPLRIRTEHVSLKPARLGEKITEASENPKTEVSYTIGCTGTIAR